MMQRSTARHRKSASTGTSLIHLAHGDDDLDVTGLGHTGDENDSGPTDTENDEGDDEGEEEEEDDDDDDNADDAVVPIASPRPRSLSLDALRSIELEPLQPLSDAESASSALDDSAVRDSSNTTDCESPAPVHASFDAPQTPVSASASAESPDTVEAPRQSPATPSYPPTIRSVKVQSGSVSVLQPKLTRAAEAVNKATFFEFVRGELVNDEFDDLDTIKVERIANLMRIPLQLEHFIAFGSLVCLDVFLALFSLLPIRFVLALWTLSGRALGLVERIPSSQKCDLLKGFIFAMSCVVVLQLDGSRLYHIIRGQNTLKLYVIYNVLEVIDRLCSAFGQDVLDSLFSKATVSVSRPYHHLQPIPHCIIALIYMFVHSLVMFLQLVTLNVAINSFSAALITVLLSNQLAEIKSNVFKKVTKENLWQISCGDVIERFQLSIFLLLIAMRNWSEMGESFDSEYLTSDFLPQVAALFFSEVIIDWLKHSFVTRFNRIPWGSYATFLDILCRDLVVQRSPTLGSYNQTPLVARRLGFSSMPLACVTVRVLTEVLEAQEVCIDGWTVLLLAIGFACLVLLKLIVGVSILGIASSRCLKSDVFNAQQYESKYVFANDLIDRFTLLSK